MGDGSDAPESSDLKEIVVSMVSKKHKSKGERQRLQERVL